MRIIVKPNNLAGELYKLLGVTSSKGPLTIVTHGLLTANDDNTVTLEATDLEVSISTGLECQVEQPGKLCLHAGNLYSVVKGIHAEEVEIVSEDNHWARLQAGNVDCRIVGVPPEEFPRLPVLEDLAFFPIPTDRLLQMVDRTIFSISTDEGRPNLMGTYLVAQDGHLLMVSTDGHRLSKSAREVDEVDAAPADIADGIIIPRKSMSELKRAVDPSVDHIRLAVSGNNAVFRFGSTTLMVRLVDASFPDYGRVIPDELPERQARVATDEFHEKLKFVTLFSNPRTNNVSVKVSGDVLELSASDPDKGEGKEVMPITYAGPAVQVGFNYRYLLDIFNVLEEPEFRFQIVDAFSAALILDGDRTDDLFLVMPMRI